MEEISFKNRFNDTLFGTSWEIDNPKAIVMIVTGMAEHSRRYDDFAKFLNENHFSVFCLDHYGQGVGKNGELGNPGRDYFFKMQETIKEFILKKKGETGLKVYLFAHSMGSFVTQGFIEKYSRVIDKVVLCGSNGPNPLVKFGYLYTQIFVNGYNYNKTAGFIHSLSIGAYEKSVKTRKSNNDWISYNKDNVEKYDNDEYSGYRPTNGFYKEFMKGLMSIQKKKNVKTISQTLPILIIGGEDDAVGNFGKGLEKIAALYKKYNLNVKLIIYEKMRHEILNEKDNLKVYNDILNFFEY